MNVLIIEDEPAAARQLQEMIQACRPAFPILPWIDTVKAATALLTSGKPVDLVFLDIHLADGHAFDLLEVVAMPCPIIFTTAYDQYAVKAFEVNSIDYLLKPITQERVCKAIERFEERQLIRLDPLHIARLQQLFPQTAPYKKSFLIPYRDKLIPVLVKEFAWFGIQQGVVIGKRFDGTVHLLEERSLDELTKDIDPGLFYRANRQFVINKEALREVLQYFNGKLLLTISPAPKDKVIVSREKVAQFKVWVTA